MITQIRFPVKKGGPWLASSPASALWGWIRPNGWQGNFSAPWPHWANRLFALTPPYTWYVPPTQTQWALWSEWCSIQVLWEKASLFTAFTASHSPCRKFDGPICKDLHTHTTLNPSLPKWCSNVKMYHMYETKNIGEATLITPSVLYHYNSGKLRSSYNCHCWHSLLLWIFYYLCNCSSHYTVSQKFHCLTYKTL